MFTGLIETVGRVEHVQSSTAGGGRRLRVSTTIGRELTDGESVAVNGTCLTVTAHDGGGFEVEISPETLHVTSLSRLDVGAAVNLERALRADARLGGHFVLGHVDGVGRVVALTD